MLLHGYSQPSDVAPVPLVRRAVALSDHDLGGPQWPHWRHAAVLTW